MDERQLKLLIVEDEPNTRDLLVSILNWDSLGIRIAGKASTGAEALDLMDELLPDIVLTDIEMPYMDGLTLSLRIKERYNDVTVIILTAHDHFKYAQQAMRANVSNYLLKPLNKDDLEKTMKETVKKVRDRRALLGQMETSYKYMQDQRQFFKDRLLTELVHKGLSEGLIDILEMVGVHFGVDSRYMLALMNIANSGMATFAAQKYFMLNNCRTYLDQNYASGGKLYVFADGLDNLVLLSHDDKTDLADICRQVNNAIGGNLKCQLYWGVSDPGRQASGLPRAYAQARDALRLAIMSGEESKYIQMESRLPSLDSRLLEERVPDLLLFVKSGLRDQATALASALLQQAYSLHEKDLNAAKVFVIGVLSRTAETLAEYGIPWMTLMKQITPYYPQLSRQQSFQALEALVTGQVSELCALTEGHHRQESSEIVSRIIRDLEEGHGDPDLSLSSMARKFYLNSSYLSRAFKGHTGKSFSEYLLEVRIQKARDMLEQSDFKAYQLAQLVGIPDPNYFAKCFKKVTGKSFQAYKAEFGKK